MVRTFSWRLMSFYNLPSGRERNEISDRRNTQKPAKSCKKCEIKERPFLKELSQSLISGQLLDTCALFSGVQLTKTLYVNGVLP